MTEILLRWIRDDVGLGQVSPELERECANGVLLGKILNHYGLFPEIDKLQNKTSPEVRQANFQRLQPALRSLNIRLNSHIANQLMTEEAGAAIKILQQLKLNLDVGSKPKDSSHRQVGSLLLKPIRVTHTPKYKNLQDQTFDSLRHLKVGNPKEYRFQHFLHGFDQEAVEQQKAAELDEELNKSQKMTFLSELRQTHLGNIKDNRDYLRSWEEEGHANHSKNQKDKLDRERRDLRLELAMREKARRKSAIESLNAADEALSGIDNFEESLRRLQVVGSKRRMTMPVSDTVVCAACRTPARTRASMNRC
jgi:hypothetical protein